MYYKEYDQFPRHFLMWCCILLKQIKAAGKRSTMIDPYAMGTSHHQVTSEKSMFMPIDHSSLSKTKWGWKNDPVGLSITLRELYEKYELPLLVTENGIG
jgi:6-phospho-beta-glucosidase